MSTGKPPEDSIANEFERRLFRMRVADKEERTQGTDKKYFVTLQIVDSSIKEPRPLIEREMTDLQYKFLNLKDLIGITLYARNPPKIKPDKSRDWYFTETEALWGRDEGIGALIHEYKYKEEKG